MTVATVDPRLRAAVDASLAWYDALCTLHSVPCGIEDDVWCAYFQPPPLHSTAKTVEPDARPDRALAALEEHGSIADSFGTFDLTREGFQLLIDAQWIHRPPQALGTRRMPSGWATIKTEPDLRRWTAHHDTQAVLLPPLLSRSSFRILARTNAGEFTAGAVLHLGTGVVSISNTWATSEATDWAELVAAANALFPGRAQVGAEEGPELERAVDAGFVTVGPQRVWSR